MGCRCMDCRHNDIVMDSDANFHRICTRCESPCFLKKVSTAFGKCDYGEVDMGESEGADDDTL